MLSIFLVGGFAVCALIRVGEFWRASPTNTLVRVCTCGRNARGGHHNTQQSQEASTAILLYVVVHGAPG